MLKLSAALLSTFLHNYFDGPTIIFGSISS